MGSMRAFWDAATVLDPNALDLQEAALTLVHARGLNPSGSPASDRLRILQSKFQRSFASLTASGVHSRSARGPQVNAGASPRRFRERLPGEAAVMPFCAALMNRPRSWPERGDQRAVRLTQLQTELGVITLPCSHQPKEDGNICPRCSTSSPGLSASDLHRRENAVEDDTRVPLSRSLGEHLHNRRSRRRSTFVRKP